MRRLALWGAVMLVALPAAPTRAQPVETPQIEAVPPAITRLLNDYGRAFQARDERTLQGVLGPPLKERELQSLRNAADVPFRQFRVRALTQFSGNLASPRVRARYPGREVLTFHVLEETTLDIESKAYVEDGAFTFVRDRPLADDPYDGWRLEGKDDLDALAFFSPYHLWDVGPVSVLRSEHFVLLTHPDVADEMRPVLDIAERGYAKAAEFWPRPVQEKYAIIVPSTTDELRELLHLTLDLSKFVAFVAAGASQERGWEPTGPRLFVHLAHLRNYNPQGRLEIVAHELLHAITRPVSGPHIPTWVEEGLANTGGGSGGRASRAGTGPAPDIFPTDDRFVRGPVDQIIVNYDRAQVAIEVLIDEFGRDALANFYEALGSARVVPGSDTYHVRRAADKALEWTFDEWVVAWRMRLG